MKISDGLQTAMKIGKVPEKPNAYMTREMKYNKNPNATPKKILNKVPPCR